MVSTVRCQFWGLCRDHFWQLLVTIGSGDLYAININTKGSLVINIIIELSNGVYGHVPILGGVEGPFLKSSWLLLVVITLMIYINTKWSPVINIIIELSNDVYGQVPILGFWRDHFWQLLVTIGSGDLDTININTEGSPVINIIIELSNGVYSHVPILGGVEGSFLTDLGYYW